MCEGYPERLTENRLTFSKEVFLGYTRIPFPYLKNQCTQEKQKYFGYSFQMFFYAFIKIQM